MATEKQVTLTRTFDAPVSLVYRAWTDCTLVQQWWGPKYFDSPFCEIDPRPGGKFNVHMRGPDGVMYPSKGTFREVIPQKRLVFADDAFADEQGVPQLEALTTVTFEDLGNRTRVIVHSEITRSTPEAAGAIEGMEEGWNQSLDKLEAHVVELMKKGQEMQ